MTAQAQTKLPEAIDAPGESVILSVHAEGAQVYECKADASGKLAWVNREPIATLLLDGKTIGYHSAGPSWELHDGSAVTGKILATAPGATDKDVLWVKLEVASHRGEGKLSGATTIQRINTHGGKPDTPCTKAGDLLSVAYSTEYVFLKKN